MQLNGSRNIQDLYKRKDPGLARVWNDNNDSKQSFIDFYQRDCRNQRRSCSQRRCEAGSFPTCHCMQVFSLPADFFQSNKLTALVGANRKHNIGMQKL
jgi:hypothetical protein